MEVIRNLQPTNNFLENVKLATQNTVLAFDSVPLA